jgi:hypothetical protein
MWVRDHFHDLFFGLGSSHLRSRLTDQGDADHFGGYADIRVLDNASFWFTAAHFLTVSARVLK